MRDIESHETPAFGAALRRWLVYSVLGLLVVGVVSVAVVPVRPAVAPVLARQGGAYVRRGLTAVRHAAADDPLPRTAPRRMRRGGSRSTRAMSTEPPPGSGEPPENDPFLKKPQEPPAGGAPRNSSPRENGSPRNHAPHGGGTGGSGTGGGEGGAPPPGRSRRPVAPRPCGPYGGGPYGGGPYAGDPYGGQYDRPTRWPGCRRWRTAASGSLARIIDVIIIGVPVWLIMTWSSAGASTQHRPRQGRVRQSTVRAVTLLRVLHGYDGLMTRQAAARPSARWLMKIRVAKLDNGSMPHRPARAGSGPRSMRCRRRAAAAASGLADQRAVVLPGTSRTSSVCTTRRRRPWWCPRRRRRAPAQRECSPIRASPAPGA